MMLTYVGTKLVRAEPMNRLQYNALRGWVVPADENPEDPGYLVEYLDSGKPNVPGYEGYVSWSPKDVFEGSYRRTAALSFSLALEMLRHGHAIARTGWNGKGMFAYLVPGNTYPASTAVAKTFYGDEPVPYNAYMALKGADGRVSTWVPSCNDCLSDDWVVLDLPEVFSLAKPALPGKLVKANMVDGRLVPIEASDTTPGMGY